jgi:mevalonate kinase
MKQRAASVDLGQQGFKVITCSAPGSIVFMGEYAALAGYPTIVAAIDQRATVSVAPIDQPILDIFSDTFGACTIDLATLSAPPSYQYTLASFKQFLPKLQHQGFRIHFHSDVGIDKQLGLSAALTVALCSAFYHHIHRHLNLEDICGLACKAVLTVSTHSSCADVAASTYGGIIRHVMKTQDQPASIRRVWTNLPIFAVYSGHITSESIVIHRGLMREKTYPLVYRKIHEDIGKLSDMFFTEIKNENPKTLGQLLDLINHSLYAYELHTQETQEILDHLQNLKTVYGAKTSGAGLGGCVIGLGAVTPADVEPYEVIPLSVDDVGVRLDPRINLQATQTAYNML